MPRAAKALDTRFGRQQATPANTFRAANAPDLGLYHAVQRKSEADVFGRVSLPPVTEGGRASAHYPGGFALPDGNILYRLASK